MSSKARLTTTVMTPAWLLFVVLLGTSLQSSCQTDEQKETSSSSSSSSLSNPPKLQAKRDRNLDLWDADTLAYHIDHYPGYDVAIMFFEQGDRNSYSLARMWDGIATHLQAGSSSSRLIMAQSLIVNISLSM
jgi:hypothetical protein